MRSSVKNSLIVMLLGATAVVSPTAVDFAVTDAEIREPASTSIFDTAIREKGPYASAVKDFASKDDPITYCAESGCMSFRPSHIQWSTGDIVKNSPSALSRREDAGNGSVFRNVFGRGFDLTVTSKPSIFSKVLSIESLAALGVIPQGALTLDVYFDFNTTFEFDDGPINEVLSLDTYTKIIPASVWDSADEYSIIRAEIKTIDDTKYLIKHIPVSWLKAAIFPVHTDVDVRYGTVAQFQDDQVNGGVRMSAIDTDQFATCYTEGSTLDCVIGTLASAHPSTNITYGATSTAVSNAFLGAGGVPDFAVCQATTDKFAIAYADADQLNDGYVRVATVSGSTISFGTALEFETGDTEQVSCANLDTDKIVISFNDETDSDTGKSIACTISGTTPTCGSATTHWNGTTDYFPDYTSTTKMDTDKFATCFVSTDNSDFECFVATVSGTTITTGTPTVIDNSLGGANSIQVSALNSSRLVFLYSETGGNPITTYGAATTTGTTISAVATSTYKDTTNSTYSNDIIAHTSDNAIGFQGTNGGDESQYLRVNWESLVGTLGDTDAFPGEVEDFAGGYMMQTALIQTNRVVMCAADDVSPFAGYCVTGILEVDDVTVTTDTSVRITSGSIRPQGTLGLGFGTESKVWFEYGTRANLSASVAYTSSTSEKTLTVNGVFDIDQVGLDQLSIYDFRAVATGTEEITNGSNIVTFTAEFSTSTDSFNDFLTGTFSNASTSQISTSTNGSLYLERQWGALATTSEDFNSVADASTDFSSTVLWKQATLTTDDGDWQGETTNTGSGGTGADAPQEGAAFIYTEASSGQSCDAANAPPNTCVIEADLEDNTTGAVDFYFVTDGAGQGTLSLDAYDGSSWRSFWSVSGDYGVATWVYAYAEIPTWVGPTDAIRFYASDGTTFASDTSLDTIGVGTTTANSLVAGTWTSLATDLSAITSVGTSSIIWTEETGSDSSVVFKTAINSDSGSMPSDGEFSEVANGQSIAGLTTGEDLTGKYLWVRIELNPSTDNGTSPLVHDYIVGITNDPEPSGLRQCNRGVCYNNRGVLQIR